MIYKIIGISNFGKENVDDILVCENITNHEHGIAMCDLLNNLYSGPTGTYYYQLVDQDRKMGVWSH